MNKNAMWFIGICTLVVCTSCTQKKVEQIETQTVSTPNPIVENIDSAELERMQDAKAMDTGVATSVEADSMAWKDMPQDATMMKDDMKTMEKDEMMKDDMSKDMMMKDDMMKEWMYTAYAPELVGAHEKTVLFFHADWCPSCRAADAGIKTWKLPADIAVLKVNYDDSQDLKKKYGVTYQHTFVQVDAQGNLIKKWSGGNSVEEIVEAVN